MRSHERSVTLGGDCLLAIAAPSFSAPSETFIRAHVRTVAPGQTILLCEDARGADALGFPVFSDIYPWTPPRTLMERIPNAIRQGWRRYIDPALGGAQREKVISTLRTRRVEAVLAEYGPMGCLLMEACRDAGVPLFVHFHGYDASLLARDWRVRRHYRRLFRLAAGVVAPSRFLADSLAILGCPREKLSVSPCGIDPSKFRLSSRVPGLVVAVGRLVEKKAPHLTIEAFARVAARHPDAHLRMIGDGPLRDRCEATIAELGLGGRVTLLLAQDNDAVVELLQQASVFAQHSVIAANGDTEGLPVAILEAMASGLPVVSTVHAGIPEAVEHGTTGILVAELDIRGMAEAIAALLDDPGRAETMGRAGRARVLQNFTIDHTRDRLRAIMGLPSTTFEASAVSNPELVGRA